MSVESRVCYCLDVFWRISFSLFPEFSEVLEMGVTVDWTEGVQPLAGFKACALPTSLNALLLTAAPYPAGRGASSLSARFLASKSDHCAQDVVALLVVFEFLEVFGQSLGGLVEFFLSQFFPQVSG